MIRALYDCIDEKLAGLFVQKETIKKEEEIMEKNNCLKNAFSKLMVRNAVVDYCNNNNLNPYDFLKMCGVNKNLLYDYKEHPYVYKYTVDKIIAATGWTMDYIEKYKDMTEPIQYIKVKPVQNKKVEEDICEEELDFVQPHPIVEKINRKLYFEDGKFYEEYDHIVTVHEKKEVTKEEFMAAIKEV